MLQIWTGLIDFAFRLLLDLPVMSRKPVLHSVDLFAGCGGLSLGLEQAGFRSLAFSEINKDAGDTFAANLGGEGVLRFGDIHELSGSRLGGLRRRWTAEGHDIDLVCGGPPCQGYSGIGHRRSYQVEKAEVPSNHLFREFVRVVRALRPRLFLFENVRGLLSGRWTAEGEKGEIWREVRETFGNIRGYEIGWSVVQAKSFGVPQNRPRVLLVGIRADLGAVLPSGDDRNETCNPRGLLPQGGVAAPDLIDALSDLDDPDFFEKSRTEKYLHPPASDFQRLMRTGRDGRPLPRNATLTDHEYSKHSPRIAEKFRYMHAHGGRIPEAMQTKKFAQRLLPARWGDQGPTITATSLPDDFVHYSQPRILTVREWARLQMFPDWFRFHGPRTTGGLRRAGVPTEGIWEREVPKYTQIGNAVPVGLARAVGEHLASILRQL